MISNKVRARRRAHRGYTLVELLVGIVIFAIIGAALINLLITQGRFFDKEGMAHAARNVSRGSLNRVASDLRMVETSGGVIAASSTSLTIRVPYAIGVVCAASGGSTHISLLPVDSVMYNLPGAYGYAWRNPNTGAYSYTEPATTSAGALSVCTGVNITTIVPGGQVVKVTPVVPVGATVGAPVFFYRKIRYEFKASTAVPGLLGLYRTVVLQSGAELSEELVAPFAATAGYKFFVVGNDTTAQASPPALLSDIRGIQLQLDGMAETKVAASASAETAPFTTAVFFKNRIN